MRFAFVVAVVAACGSTTAPVATAPVGTAPIAVPIPELAPAPPQKTAGAPALAVAQPALIESPLPGDGARVTIHRLSNGMTVYISPDPTAATIVAHVVVHAGSSNDPEHSTGLAHYLEHMLFKGTERMGTLDYAKEKPHLDRIAALYDELRGPHGDRDRDRILADIDAESIATADVIVPNELDSVVDKMGFTGTNAYTNGDVTSYITTLPKNRLAQWARVQADRFEHPVFRLFWQELEAVYEEKNRSLDNWPTRVSDAMWRGMFPRHGYGWSDTLGEVEHLKRPAYADMVAFFERYYTPKNMALVLSGAVDDSALPLLEREFGGFTRPAGAAREPGVLDGVHGRTVVDVTVPTAPGVILVWRLPAANDPDTIALEVVDQLIDDGTVGLMSRDLRIPQKVASAGSFPSFAREAGVWQLSADQLVGQTADDVERQLMTVVADVRAGKFTDDDLRGAVLAREVAHAQSIETTDSRVSMMESAFVRDVPWATVVDEGKRVAALTRADIVRAAVTYLNGDVLVLRKVVGTASPPKIVKPKITPFHVDPSRRSTFANDVLTMPADPIDAVPEVEGRDYTRGKLATGELVAVANTRDELFHVDYRYDYARVDDRLACFALGMLDVSGAGDRSAEQVGRDLYALGVRVSFGCDKDHSTISLDGVDRNLEPALAIVKQWLADPRFDAGTVARARDAARTQRANIVASPGAIVAAVQAYAAFGGDTQQLVDASDQELAAATPERLAKIIGRYLKMAHRTSYFGPRASDAAKLVTLGDGSLATTARKPARYRNGGAGGAGGVTACDQDTAQTKVWMWWPRAPATDADRAVGTLYWFYEGTLLYRDVREVRGLAYSVGGGWLAGSRKQDDATAYAYIGTQGDKTDDAIAAILDTLRAPVDDHRLAEAKERIDNEHRAARIEPRALASTVYGWEDDGEHADPRDARVKRTLAVDRAALDAWAKRAVAGKPLVSVVGKRDKLDDKKLAKLAAVTWVPVSKVFAY